MGMPAPSSDGVYEPELRRWIFTREEWSELEKITLEIVKKGKRENKDWWDYETYKARIRHSEFSHHAYVEALRQLTYLLDL